MMRIRGELYSNVDEIPNEKVQLVIRKTIADLVDMAGGLEKLVEGGFLEGLPAPIIETHATIIEEITEEPIAEQKGVSNIELEEDVSFLDSVSTIELGQPQRSAEESATAEQKAFLEQLRNQSFGTPEPEAPRTDASLLGRLSRITNRATPESEEIMPKLDIGSQINTILQDKLTKMPTFSGRHIELRSKLRGELEFIVDGRSYDAVGEIPDNDVKELLQSAIAEWERS